MSPSIAEQYEKQHDRDVRHVVSSSADRIRVRAHSATPIVFLIGAVLLFFAFISAGVLSQSDELFLSRARGALLATGTSRAEGIVADQSAYRRWLLAHGSSFEVRAFDSISGILFNTISEHIRRSGDEGIATDFFSRAYISFECALLRLSFVLLAAWRLCLVSFLVAGYVAMRSLRGHTRKDILGVTGDARLFYSGEKLRIDEVDARGVPTFFIPGVASPKRALLPEVKRHALGKLLTRYGIKERTPFGLASVVLAYPEVPAHVVPKEERELFEQAIYPTTLVDFTTAVVSAALKVHARYRKKEFDFEIPLPATPGRRLTSEQYSERLSAALHQVLTMRSREALATLSAAEIATTLIGAASGKVMAYAKEAGRWVKFSSHPELCARAILYSTPEFFTELQPVKRDMVRGAIIASVGFESREIEEGITSGDRARRVTHLPLVTQALEQWCSLAATFPHNLDRAQDRSELLGIISELFREWPNTFSDSVIAQLPEVMGSSFAYHKELLVVPARTMISLFRKHMSRSVVDRVQALLDREAHEQLLHSFTLDDVTRPARSFRPPPIVVRERGEVKQLAEQHGMFETEVREWEVLKVVLSCYGWLATRVDTACVPDHGLLFGVVTKDNGESVGKRGLVPLRAHYLETRWGREWSARFELATALYVTDLREQFDRRLKELDGERRAREMKVVSL